MPPDKIRRWDRRWRFPPAKTPWGALFITPPLHWKIDFGASSSFNDKPVNEAVTGSFGKELFEKEHEDLLADLKDIPEKSLDRRISEFVKRARAAKIHAYIIGHLKKEMPFMIGKAKARKRLINNLADEFQKIQKEFNILPGDFPDVDEYKEILTGYNLKNFRKLKPKMIQAIDNKLCYDIPYLLKRERLPCVDAKAQEYIDKIRRTLSDLSRGVRSR